MRKVDEAVPSLQGEWDKQFEKKSQSEHLLSLFALLSFSYRIDNFIVNKIRH